MFKETKMSDMERPATGEPIRIPVDAKATDDVESLVREYEEKYNGFRAAESGQVSDTANGKAKYAPPPKPKRVTVIGANVSDDERMWAAIAHGSAVLTLILGLMSAGVISLFTLFIPLGIYFTYRHRSEFVAYAALQAFALQLLGTVGFVAVLVGGALVSVLLTVVLAITLIGIIGIPFVWLAFAILALAALALPLGMLVFGMIAAWESYQGKDYRYPIISAWLDRQMHVGFMTTL
jgi:uncharacterized Tic20 family protein